MKSVPEFLLALLLLSLTAFAQQHRPVVFISSDVSISTSATGFALGPVATAGASVSKDDKTTQVAHELMKSCPEISLTLSDASPDYMLLVHHQPGYWNAVNELMVLMPDKSVLFATGNKRNSRTVKDSCKAIMADWQKRRPRADDAAWWKSAQPKKDAAR
ncbi:MAG: hypothetical protein WCF26_18870 [Candidatus Sulfotelmatobacter sp.]